ncbi:MAG: hypothetical protein HY716_14415 [Planctomycetes bacterium]|nr:hypothetical protein [Planctomycetota bacterium]
MGTFTRGGDFRDRSRFLAELRGKLERMRNGPLRGASVNWREDAGTTRAILAGFGATLAFTVDESSWTCEANVPDWIPIPPSVLEAKFDEEFRDLKDL